MKPRYSIFLLSIIFLLLCLCTCSVNDLAGVETTNGNVIATIYDSQGKKAAGVAVNLVPENYNPVKDGSLPNYLTDTTDVNGTCIFTSQTYGIYNLEGVHTSDRYRFLYFGLTVGENLTTIADTLSTTGTIKVFLPDTVDSAEGFFYVAGTSISKIFASGISEDVNGKKFIYIDSVPGNNSVSLRYGEYSQEGTLLINRLIKVMPMQVSEITVTDLTIKPTWGFPIIAGIPEQTFQYYNNDIDSLKRLIAKQISHMNNNFNDSTVFNGVFNFHVDSFYIFTTSPISDEFINPPSGYAYRLIYDAFTDKASAFWYRDVSTVYHCSDSKTGGNLFVDTADNEVTHLFGVVRGCLTLSLLSVVASQNPVNGAAYTAGESIMNNPGISTRWDTLNIDILNYYEDSTGYEKAITHDAFPPSIGITAQTSGSTPLDSVTVNVYTVFAGSGAVSTPAKYTGITDTNGEFIFSENPFIPDSGPIIPYPNLLIQAINGSDTTCEWLPITEVNNAWFDNPGGVFKKKIIF